MNSFSDAESMTNKRDIAQHFSDLSVAQYSESNVTESPSLRQKGGILDLCSSSDESQEEKDDFQCTKKEMTFRNASAVSTTRTFKSGGYTNKKRKLNERREQLEREFVPIMPFISFPTKNTTPKQSNGSDIDLLDDNHSNKTPPLDNNHKKENEVKTPTAPKKSERSAHIPVSTKKPRRLIFASKNPMNMLCSEKVTAQQFLKDREQYTSWIFERLNTGAFGDRLVLNDNLTFEWCKTLNKTAGDCRLIQRTLKGRKAHIRLATKILTDLDKLKQTFCHEMCHAMAWVVDGIKKPPHGPHFQHWANEAESAFNDIKVTTCHNYKIQYKFQWQCTKCKYIYGRHSKSIKLDKHRCGVCKSKLEFMGKLQPDGNYVVPKARATSAFTLFMKENMATVKRRYPKAKHSEIMKILSEQYKVKQKTKK